VSPPQRSAACVHPDPSCPGTLDGTDYTLASDGFSQPGKQAATPHRLLLPDSVRQIACGRLHTLMLSARGTVYTFCAWGRPFVLRSPLLAPSTPVAPAHDAIAQVAAGWGFCAARTREGAVLVWWPGAGALKEAYDTAARDMDERVRQGEDALKALPTAGTRDIPCHVFELAVEPVVLPELPYDLPELAHTGESDYARRADVATRIVEIAGADNALIALTNRGHVLKYDHLIDEVAYTQGRWTYVRVFH
jgi:SCF-associated factor 1